MFIITRQIPAALTAPVWSMWIIINPLDCNPDIWDFDNSKMLLYGSFTTKSCVFSQGFQAWK